MIRLTVPSIDSDDLEAVEDVLRSGQLVQGPRVAAFERVIAERLGVPCAVAVSSGTAALHLALAALDIGVGESVIVPAYSFPATANVVELCGAVPVFVDIDPFSFTMDPGCLEVALAKGCSGTIRPVKAIMPVHAFGRMAAMPEIQAIAERYGVTVVEDAACAFGATTEGRPAGTWGRLGCFSFHPRKSVTTGEGGVTVTSDHALDARLRMLRNHGQDPSAQAPDFVMAGWNYRMTDMQGALGVTQLAKADRIIEARRDAARRYDGLLRTLPVETPGPVGNDHTFQSYVVLLDADVSVPREEVIRRLRSRMVEAAIGTWHLPLTTHFRSQYAFAPGDFPVTDDVFARSLTLPLYESIDLSTQQAVVAALSDSLATP